MGLLRKAIVLGVIVYALPSVPPDLAPGSEATRQISTLEAVSAANDTWRDAQGFCGRQPQACVTGYYLTNLAQGKIRYAMQLAASWSGNRMESGAISGAPKLKLVTLTDLREKKAAVKPSKIEDLLN